MLPKQHRLRRSADILSVRKSGISWRHPLFVLLIQDNGLAFSRFGFVASRRVGNAVVRNRAKRVLREAVHMHLKEIVGGKDCLFIVRSKLSRASFQDVETAVSQKLTQAKLIIINGESA